MKICFKCKKNLPLTEYYKHKGMADGRLNKCKNCTKEDTKKSINLKKKDSSWLNKERERCRMKTRKARAEGKLKESPQHKKTAANAAWRKRNPNKARAHNIAKSIKRLPCQICGNPNSQRHHEDYSKPKDVIMLCAKHHAERHIEMRKL